MVTTRPSNNPSAKAAANGDEEEEEETRFPLLLLLILSLSLSLSPPRLGVTGMAGRKEKKRKRRRAPTPPFPSQPKRPRFYFRLFLSFLFSRLFKSGGNAHARTRSNTLRSPRRGDGDRDWYDGGGAPGTTCQRPVVVVAGGPHTSACGGRRLGPRRRGNVGPHPPTAREAERRAPMDWVGLSAVG